MLVLPRFKVADRLVAGKLIPQARFVSSRGRFRHVLKVSDHSGLGPVNAVGRTATEKCAVASVARLDEFNIWIGKDSFAGFGNEANKWIILRAKNESGNSNSVDDTSAGGAVVVVVCIAEAAMGRDDLLVELPDRAHRTDVVAPIDARKQRGHAPVQ